MKEEGLEMEKMESKKSRFADEGRRRRRRRRKAEMDTSFDTYLVYSPDSMGSSGRFDSFNHDDDELLSLAVRACTNNGPVPVLVPDPAQEMEKPTNDILTPPRPHLSPQLKEPKNPSFQQENQDPTKKYFTHSLKECQREKHLPESIPLTTRKLLRQRTGSLDLNNHVSTDVSVLSPFAAAMSKSNFSPGTPVYTNRPGWQSERVPLGSHKYRLNGRNRNLPSKWEDAERWIFSPVSSEMGLMRTSKTQVPTLGQRRPKAKSGPLGSPLSPSSQVFHSGRVGNFVKNSPLWAGVLVPENGIGTSSGTGKSFSNCVSSCSLPSSRCSVQDERIEMTRKEVGTQTSPCGSSNGSPKSTPIFSPNSKTMEELESRFSELEINKLCKNNDDHDDGGQVTFMRWSKKQVMKKNDKFLTNIIDWKRRVVEEKIKTSCSCQVTETTNCISKFENEEDKITAWENMQKAKAEASIQKLVIKLEKKRSSSMNKILNKLNFAHKKAQDLRTSASNSNQTKEVPRNTKRVLHCNKNAQITSLSGCFTCHAF